MIRYAFALILSLAALPASAEVDIQEVTSPGGITAWLVEEHSIPFVAVEIRFKGGASLDAPGKRGAANLMTATLEEGAAGLSAQEFAEARDSLAASFDFDIYDDAMSVSAKMLTENRSEAVMLLRDALLSPRFDTAAVERVKAQVQSTIRSETTDPNDIASATFDRMAFGDHPYGSSLNGTAESVAALTRDDMIEAKNRILTRDRIYVGVVGDITPQEVGAMLDTLLGDLPATGAPMPERVDFGIEGGVTVVDFETPQSVALFGHSGITRDDPDFFPAYILNLILGGSNFEARLMTEVREKRGLTYGIYSYLVPKDHAEMVLGSVSSANDRIAEAIAVIRDVWADTAANGVTAEELEAAKTYLTGAYPLRFDGNGPIANIMVGMQMQGLPIDYIATRNAKVEAVTLDEINAMAKRLLRPDALHFVVVGQPEGVM